MEEAGALIESAREQKKLLCVSRDDLLAPYKKRERRNHVQMCEALSKLSIPMSVEDFIGEDCVNILQFANVEDGNELMVVTCHYTIDFPKRSAALEERLRRRAEPGSGGDEDRDLDDVFASEVAAGSITFNLFSVAAPG